MGLGIRGVLGIGTVCLPLLALLDCGGKGSARPEGEESGGSAGTAATGGSGGKPISMGRAGTAGTTGAAGTAPRAACTTPTADDYAPVWRPPVATPGACSAQQISDQFTLCQSDKYDEKACRAFNTDSANGECLGCLFSANDTKESHAVLLLRNGYRIANVGGCIALIDGDSSGTGCGARTQAAGVCEYDACLTACTQSMVTDADWNACLASARAGACSSYVEQAACTGLPRYAACQYPTWEEYFKGFGDLFCGSGPPADVGQGGASQGGAADAAGAAP